MLKNMQNPSSYQTNLRTLSILHYALLAGLLMFSGLAYFLIGPTLKGGEAEAESFNAIYRYLIPGIAIIAIVYGRFIGNQLLAKAKEEEDIGAKLSIYRNAALIRWSLMEGAGMFAVIAYLFTGNQVFIMISLAAAAYLFTQKPTARLVSRELNLSNAESRELER